MTVRLLLLLLASLSLPAQSVIELLEHDTFSQLNRLDEESEGVLGVAAIDLTNRRTFSYHADSVFPQASSIKIPILVAMYQRVDEGKLRMADSLTLLPRDGVQGSGHLKGLLEKGPLTLTWKELVTAMMETSDNTATNASIRLVGMDRVNAILSAHGLEKTRLQRVMLDTAAAKADRENISTPAEMAHFVELLYRGRLATQASTEEMIGIMRRVKATFRKVIPPAVDVASKPGGVPGVQCETGIVYLKNRPFILSIMTTFVPPQSTLLEKATAIAFRHFEKLAESNSYGHKVE